MWYKIDWNKFIILSLPTFLRNSRMGSLLGLFSAEMNNIHYTWEEYRKDNIYKLNHNSQVCYLRKALNDRFDPVNRRIVITGSHRYKQQYIYTEVEKKDKYLGTLYLRQDVDFADNGVDFLVLAPSELLDADNYEMKALIDYYKLASKRYKIEPLEDI